jgi:orotate phosphoribosyltransferase
VVDLGNLKTTQTAVTDPTASGTTITAIATISQDTNGVITATKKTIRSASSEQSGVMSAADYTKLAGIATGAIAHGALVADSLALPMVYVRSTPKDHGLENLIEGDIKPGEKVVLIEDQLSTGNNCLKCLNTVREAGGIVLGAVVIFDYQFSAAAKALKRAKLPIVTLTNFGTMLDVAMDNGKITQADADTLQQWHNDPENWAPAGFDSVD